MFPPSQFTMEEPVKLNLITVLTLASLLLACGGKQTPADSAKAAEPAAEPAATPAATPAAEPAHLADGPHPGLLDPAQAKLSAPPKFKAKFSTTKGDFVVEVNKEWAPKAADRFFSLVTIGYYVDIPMFRVIEGFMVQFGIHGDPKMNKIWKNASIPDDKGTQSNTPGMLTFATRGPNTRTTQLFINYGQNARLDGMGFAPFGKVIEGMDVVNNVYSGYGEGAPRGRGPSQPRMQGEGNTYLKAEFPEMDYIKSISILK
jgi:peptidyl-prolyl cis-trans isomerase A (cyclophilin A)